MNRLKHLILVLISSALSILLVLFIGEIVARFYSYHKYGLSPLNGANNGIAAKADKRLGWTIGANIKYETHLMDALGKPYTVNFETNKYGFRLFGDPSNSNERILCIGDSYTAASEVSNDKAYYGLLKHAVKNIDMYSYGVGGYGSLQEYLVLDSYIDNIKPNVIIWQFCWNDFMDNNYDLDFMRTLYNNGTPRPYLGKDNSIEYKYPPLFSGLIVRLPGFISENLRIVKYLDKKVSQLTSALREPQLKEIERIGTDNSEFRESVSITKRIMRMVKERAGKTPIILFCVPYKQPYYDELRNICDAAGIIFIDSVGQALLAREKEENLITRSADREHFNEEGHRIIYENLLEALKSNGMVK